MVVERDEIARFLFRETHIGQEPFRKRLLRMREIEEPRYFSLEDCFSYDKQPKETVEILVGLEEKLREKVDTPVMFVGLVGLKEKQSVNDLIRERVEDDLTGEEIEDRLYAEAPQGRIFLKGKFKKIRMLNDVSVQTLPLLPDKLLASLLLARRIGDAAIAQYPHFRERGVAEDEFRIKGSPFVSQYNTTEGWISEKSLLIMHSNSLELLKKECAKKIGVKSDRLSEIERLLEERIVEVEKEATSEENFYLGYHPQDIWGQPFVERNTEPYLSKRWRKMSPEERQDDLVMKLTLVELMKHDPEFTDRGIDSRATQEEREKRAADIKIRIEELRREGKISSVGELREKAAEMVDLDYEELCKALDDYSEGLNEQQKPGRTL